MSISRIIVEARSRNFQDKLRYYLTKTAIAVMAESDTTKNHAHRIAYAGKLLKGQANILEIGLAVLTNQTIAVKVVSGEDYDGDIEYVITTIFDAFANAEAV